MTVIGLDTFVCWARPVSDLSFLYIS